MQRQLPPIQGELVASLIDEIPVLAVLGSQAAGGLTISDANELRVKESDRISAIVKNLRAMGAEVIYQSIVPDEPDQIASLLIELVDELRAVPAVAVR